MAKKREKLVVGRKLRNIIMDDKTIARIMKVNHAGEYGAIRIYNAQLLVSKILHKELVTFLETIVAHEIDHCQKFIQAMHARQARSCAAMSFWGIGGWTLGFITACLGKNAIMICTAAVEETVHRHLQEQIIYLENRDEELRRLIIEIQKEELQHLQYAENNLKNSLLARPLSYLITISTEIVIWLSTQGDVSKMRNAIRAYNY